MDLLCLRCGEQWDFDLVLHELPEQFERQGCVISRCPACTEKASVSLPKQQREELEALAVLGDLFGDDCDAFAAFLSERALD